MCASGQHLGGHYFWYFGPSGVRALPLAAGRNEGGHYFHYKNYNLPVLFLFLPPLFKTTEGVVIGIQIFAWAPKNKCLLKVFVRYNNNNVLERFRKDMV